MKFSRKFRKTLSSIAPFLRRSGKDGVSFSRTVVGNDGSSTAHSTEARGFSIVEMVVAIGLSLILTAVGSISLQDAAQQSRSVALQDGIEKVYQTACRMHHDGDPMTMPTSAVTAFNAAVGRGASPEGVSKNFVSNPSFESGLATGWGWATTTGATTEVVDTPAKFGRAVGDKSMAVLTDANTWIRFVEARTGANPGDWAGVRIWLGTDATNVRAQLETRFRYANGTSKPYTKLTNLEVIPSGEGFVLTGAHQMVEGDNDIAEIVVRLNSTSHSKSVPVYVDGGMITISSSREKALQSVSSYLDGTSNGWTWDGAPHLSVSSAVSGGGVAGMQANYLLADAGGNAVTLPELSESATDEEIRALLTEYEKVQTITIGMEHYDSRGNWKMGSSSDEGYSAEITPRVLDVTRGCL